jgi:hypothetical protein
LWTVGTVIVLLILGSIGAWLWGVLSGYIQPKTPTDKKDLVNIFVLIAAGVIGTLTAIAALINLSFSRRNLQNAQAALRQQEATLRQQRDLDLSRRADEALQAYFEQMGDLLIDKGLLEKDDPFDTTRVTTRARTLAVLPQLDGERKRWIVQFLYDGQLINNETEETAFHFGSPKFTPRIVGLSGADLKNAKLRDLTLAYAALNGAILENADLRACLVKVRVRRFSRLTRMRRTYL